MKRQEQPKPRRHVLFCPHCGNKTGQVLLCSQQYEQKFYSVSSAEESDHSSQYNVVKCETCSEVLLYTELLEPGFPHESVFGDLVYPKPIARMGSVPDNVRKIFLEAQRVKAISPIAFVVLARRLLEEICIDKGLKGKTLYDNLKALAKRGELPPVTAEASDLVRLIGNAGAHASATQVTVPDTWAIEEFIRVVLEYVYVAPAQIEEFKKRLADRAKGH